jgi:hypothetical protein
MLHVEGVVLVHCRIETMIHANRLADKIDTSALLVDTFEQGVQAFKQA